MCCYADAIVDDMPRKRRRVSPKTYSAPPEIPFFPISDPNRESISSTNRRSRYSFDAPLDHQLYTSQASQAHSHIELRILFYKFRTDIIERCDDVLATVLTGIWDLEWAIGRMAMTQEELDSSFRLIAEELDNFESKFGSGLKTLQRNVINTEQTIKDP